MSPRRLTPASPTLRNSTPTTRTPRTTRHASTYIPAQPTMWQFIRPQLPTQPIQQPILPMNNSHLNPVTQSQSTNPSQSITPTPLTSQQHQSQPTIPIIPLGDNLPWGDTMHLAQPHDFFQVLSKNVGTLNTNSLDMTAITTELHAMNTSIFLAQKTNTVWNPMTLQQLATQCHQVYHHKKMATSSSSEKCKGNIQPGGTLTLALGKWASRVIHQGHDKLLGRWSYLELIGQNGKCIIIASAYRVCTQEFNATMNTVTAQQTRLLQQQGIKNPKPRIQFLTDLIQQIQTWRQAGKEIILSMDANEDVDHPHSEIMRLFNETDLIDLHHHRYLALRKPATHQ